ncbi:MAG: Rne/Rng family ribonuclease [Deltaproteobacteria bacterium]|nr:Rne/Rng family ribonuclease [Candidatus Anaeroferrophillus wilburensis]MBN2889132.1 Rne/Rng family ribonuclease [Deltaproteobacteria bacterium]
MAAELLINWTEVETRVALLENGILAEIFYERSRDLGIVGNIYKGKVVRVLPGMDAAFVDIGLDKAAFLYVSDICRLDELEQVFTASDGEEDRDPFPFEEGGFPIEPGSSEVLIGDLLQEGQEILARVSREPFGSKGARITTYHSLPGRYLVLLPTVNHLGVSRKIVDEEERRRLRELAAAMKPVDMGLIVRTASEGTDAKALAHDLDFLLKLWESIQRKQEGLKAPAPVYQDLRLPERLIRDLYNADIDRLLIDSEVECRNLRDFVSTFFPGMHCTIELYRGGQPLFQAYDIEMEVNKALDKKVWLKSGGSIVIESTEALTAIDVNTSRFVGKRNLEDTILKTNLEAAKEIAFQLRLRNIGGIIIIDFIDMESKANRERVYSVLEEALKRDKAKANVLKISELGMVEMTRERTRKSLTRYLCDPCPYCEGRGFVKSQATITYEIIREIRSYSDAADVKEVVVMVSPDVADYLYDAAGLTIDSLELEMAKKITIKKVEPFHQEEYEVIGQR